jgi:hypothetical protein
VLQAPELALNSGARQRWLDAAKRILDFVYAGEDEDADSASASPNGVAGSHQPSAV